MIFVLYCVIRSDEWDYERHGIYYCSPLSSPPGDYALTVAAMSV